MPDPSPHEPPRPTSKKELLRLAGRLAAGRIPDLSGLTLDELREVWALVYAQWELWDWAGQPPPEPDPDAPRLTPDECMAVLVELRVPTATEIVAGIFEEPVMQVALAGIKAAIAALTMPKVSRP